MAHYAMTIQSPMSADEAFAFVSDLRKFAEWDPGVESSTQVEGDGPGLGAAYDVVASGTELTYRITEFDFPTRLVAEAETEFLTSHDVITVEEQDDGCLVTYDATLELSVPIPMGDTAFAAMFQEIGDKASDGMAKALNGTKVV